MSDSPYAYFSKMFQAVPQLMEVQKHAGGVFVSSRNTTISATKKLYPGVEIAKYSSWFTKFSQGYKALDNAPVIVTGAAGRSIFSQFSAKTCMVFHGTYTYLSKDTLKLNTHFDLLAIIGPRMRHTVDRCRDELGLNVVETGYLLFGSFPEKTEALKVSSLRDLGLNPDKKTIVYMPGGKPYGSWMAMAEKMMLETPKEFNLILRPHPSQGLTSRYDDRQSFKRVLALAKLRTDTLLDLSACPLAQLFSIADLMITDGTSPAEESLFYDVPQMFIKTPLWSKDVIRDIHGKAMYEDDLEQIMTLFDCGLTYDTESLLPYASAVYEAFNIAESVRKQRKDYFSWVFGKGDRQAGARVYQAIKNLLN